GLQINSSATVNLLAANQISDAASVVVGGTFNIGANNETIGELDGGGNVVTSAGGTLTIGSTNNLDSQFDGVISGTGSIAKGGGGTLTLTNANTFGGSGQTVALNAGRLVWSADNNLGSAANSITFGGGTLVFGDDFATNRSFALNTTGTIDTNNNEDTASGVVSGTGTLAKIGTGTLTLSGNNTYTGGTSIAGGNTSILSVSSAANLGTGGLTMSGGSVLAATGTFNLPNAITLGAAGGNTQLDGNQVSGIFNVAGGTTLTETAAGVISGGRLMKDGLGTLELLGANTYASGTYLHNGTLSVSNANSLGALSTLADPWTAGVTIDNGATLRFASSYNSYPGRGIAIGTGGAVFDAGSAIAQFMNGPMTNVSGQGGGLTKTGIGTFGLGGTNTFAGDVNVNGGVLSISRDANLGAASNQLYLTGGATLRIEDGIDNFGATPANPVLATFATGRQVNLLAGLDSIEVKNFADTNTSFGVGGAPARPASHQNTLTIDGLMTGSGTLVKEGNGTLVLTNTSNSYTGGTIVNGGTLSASDASQLGIDTAQLAINNGSTFQATANLTTARDVALGGTGGPATVGGGTLDVVSGFTETLSGVVQGSGSLSKTGLGTLFLSGTNTYDGGTFLNAGTVQINTDASLGSAGGAVNIGSATLQVLNDTQTSRGVTLSSASSALQVDGNSTYGINGSVGGVGALTKTGTGTLTLFGSNSYTGGTTISSGTISVNSNVSLGSATSPLTIGAGSLNVVSGFASTRAMTLTDVTSTLQVSGGETFTNSGAISGSGSLTKTGAGTAVLAGNGTYTGSTRISGGSLVAAGTSGGALAGTSGVTVDVGANLSLGASNQINNAATITLAGGTLFKSDFSEGSASAAGMGSLDLSADSHIDFGTGTTGTLAFAIFNPGAFTLTVDNWTGTPSTIGDATTDRLIFGADPNANLLQFVFSGYDGAVAFDLGNGFFEVTPLSPVPEINPAVVASLLCAFLGVVLHRRSVRARVRK
ncbi:MAG: beta strand repeat-containing protein, partial [Chthoniobacterales bacterium]